MQYLTRLPISHAEYIQVLKYHHLEHYSAHHDFFNPREYANNPQMLREVEGGARNRLATVFFYLNNVSRGGETNFPRAQTASHPQGGPVPRDDLIQTAAAPDRARRRPTPARPRRTAPDLARPRPTSPGLPPQVPRDYFDCSQGLSVFPQEGKVIIFYSMLPNGEMDEYSLHGELSTHRPPTPAAALLAPVPPPRDQASCVTPFCPRPQAAATCSTRRRPSGRPTSGCGTSRTTSTRATGRSRRRSCRPSGSDESLEVRDRAGLFVS